MVLKALLPYYGCKRQLAPRIVAALGDHQAYAEPFCGSMAVLLAKPSCRMELVNDLHGDVVNLARVVASDELAPALYERLVRTACCEALYEDSVAWLKVNEGPPMERAAHYLVASWLGRNGFAGTERELSAGFCRRFTSSGGDPAVRFRHVVESVPWWWERLRGVTILSMDALEVCRRFEDRETAVTYIDPPYIYKNSDYRHDLLPAQHKELAEVLRRFKKTRVVVSYYEVPELEELYLRHGWRMERLDVNKNLGVASGVSKAPEVLLINQ